MRAVALPPSIATLYFQGFASIRVHSRFFLGSWSDLPGAVGLGGRGYPVKEDSAPYAFAEFDSDEISTGVENAYPVFPKMQDVDER
jgi:hypothetical protein